MSATDRARPHGLLRGWWKELTTFAADTGGRWNALRVSVAVTVPLSVLLALGHPELTSHAVFGALSSVYGKNYAARDRLRAQLGAGTVLTAAVTLGAVVGVAGPASAWSVVLMSLLSVAGYLTTRRFGWLPVPSLFLVFAAGTTSFIPHAWEGVVVAFSLSALSALFGALVGQTGILFPRARSHTVAAPLPTPLKNIFGAPGARTQMLQYAIGPLIAGGTATALGLGHPYWAAVSATVPLMGTTLAAQLGRATLRLLGTLVGIGIAAALISLMSPVWMLVLAVAVLQVLIELTVTRNYGIAVACITPAALILSHLATPTDVAVLVADRVLETALGITVAAAVLLLRVPRRTGPPPGARTRAITAVPKPPSHAGSQ